MYPQADPLGPLGPLSLNGGSGEGSESNEDLTTAPPIAIAGGSTQPDGSDFNLTIRTLTGQNIPISFLFVPESTTVEAIKDAIEDSQDIPVQFQRLIFGGREIQDHELISSLHLSTGDTVHMLLRQNQPAAGHAQNQPNAGNLEQDIYVPVEPDNHHGQDPADRSSRLLATMQLSRAVKIFTVIDGIFLLLSAFSIWPLAVGVLLAICGYHGASQFRVGLTVCYLVYLVLAIGLRGYWFGLSIDEDQYFIAVIMMLSILIEAYIFYIVWKFVQLLRHVTPHDRVEMIEIIHGPAPMMV